MTAQSANPPPSAAVESLVHAVVQRAGYELESIDVVRTGKRQLVRIIVDSDDGVPLDAIAQVSRAVAAELDERDGMLAGAYTLEVTSPGVDRPLIAPRHWRRNRLRLVKAKLTDGGAVVGRVGDCDDDAVTLLVAGALRRVRFAEIDRAVVEVEFRPPPDSDIAALGGRAEDRDGKQSRGGNSAHRTAPDMEER